MGFLCSNESVMNLQAREEVGIPSTPSFWFSLDRLKGGWFVPGYGIWNCPRRHLPGTLQSLF